MSVDALQAWREPICADWRAEIAGLVERLASGASLSSAEAGRLRRLATMRIGAGERLQLRRLARRMLALGDPPPGFGRFRLLLVSNRTLSFLASDLEAAGLARSLLIETAETDYDAVRAVALGQGEAPEAASMRCCSCSTPAFSRPMPTWPTRRPRPTPSPAWSWTSTPSPTV